jgi:hypothetical protein
VLPLEGGLVQLQGKIGDLLTQFANLLISPVERLLNESAEWLWDEDQRPNGNDVVRHLGNMLAEGLSLVHRYE